MALTFDLKKKKIKDRDQKSFQDTDEHYKKLANILLILYFLSSDYKNK